MTSQWRTPGSPHSGEPGHSNALESRITRLEVHKEHQDPLNAKTSARLTLLERAVAAGAVILSTLAHEKLPDLAKYVGAIVKAIP